MKTQDEHLSDLREIRSLMERNSRFLSLSGLSGVAAGIWALLGATAIYVYLDMMPFASKRVYYVTALTANKWGFNYIHFFMLVGALVMLGALSTGIYFSTRHARRQGLPLWNKMTWKVIENIAIPLLTGGVFCVALHIYGRFGLIAPSTLIFYGLALVNASKYTFDDIRYLGLAEIGLGIFALFNIGFGLEFWAIGFGVLHIIYGALLYNKYEKEA